MIRGIRFEVPNKRYPIIYIVLKNIEISKYSWFIVEEDVIDDFFKSKQYPGAEFEDIINDETCYAIFLNLQAYESENDFVEIKSYNDFLKSKCELIFLIDDNIYIAIYTKDKNKIEKIRQNAEKNNFKNIEYITDENDRRQELRL